MKIRRLISAQNRLFCITPVTRVGVLRGYSGAHTRPYAIGITTCRTYSTVVIDEAKLKVEETEVYVWAAVDVEMFGVIHIEVSPGRSDLDVLLFAEQVLKRYRGKPVVFVDRGPRYNWALDDLDLCD